MRWRERFNFSTTAPNVVPQAKLCNLSLLGNVEGGTGQAKIVQLVVAGGTERRCWATLKAESSERDRGRVKDVEADEKNVASEACGLAGCFRARGHERK